MLPSDAPEKAHRAQDIYQRFFTPQSRSEVNITAKMRDQIADRVVFHSDNLFDEPQKEVRYSYIMAIKCLYLILLGICVNVAKLIKGVFELGLLQGLFG